MWISVLLAFWKTDFGRTVILIAFGVLAFYGWTAWNRQDAARAVIEAQEKEHAEIVKTVDRAAYGWRECLVSGGVWQFESSRCADPE